jgi:hypothetical protein
LNTRYLNTCHPLGSTITHKKIIQSSCSYKMHIEAFHKVSSLYNQPSRRRRVKAISNPPPLFDQA